MLPKDITQPILNYSNLLACNCNQPLSTFYFKEKKGHCSIFCSLDMNKMGSLFFRDVAVVCKSTNEICNLIYITWFQFSLSFRLFSQKKKKSSKPMNNKIKNTGK